VSIDISASSARRAGAILCAWLAVLGGPARAQQPAGPPAPPVELLVAEAMANAPSIAARRARLAAAQAALPASEAPDDPMVEFEYRDGAFPRQTFGSDPMTMAGASVRQPLLSKARRTARRAMAEAEVGERHAETDAVACDLTAAIRQQYARLYAVDREAAVLADATEVADLLSTTAASRYASGASDQATVLRAQLERTRLGERLTDLQGQRATLVATLNRLAGRPPSQPFGIVVTLSEPPPLPTGLDALPDRAGDLSPEVSVRKAEARLAERRIDAAQAELKPGFTVGGGVYWQGGFDRVVTLTLGVELPFRKNRRQLPLLDAARREAEASRAEIADATAEARAEAARLVAEIRRAEAQMNRYRTGLLPQSSAALDATRASYLGGRGDFTSVVDEFRRWTEIRVELGKLEAARFAARGQLDVLVNPAEHGDWSHPHTGTESNRETAR
jgi:outer membrane protein, heavy metal efflux system